MPRGVYKRRKKRELPTVNKPIVKNITVDVYSDVRGEDGVPLVEDAIYKVNFNPTEGPLEIGFGDNSLWVKHKGSQFVLDLQLTEEAD